MNRQETNISKVRFSTLKPITIFLFDFRSKKLSFNQKKIKTTKPSTVGEWIHTPSLDTSLASAHCTGANNGGAEGVIRCSMRMLKPKTGDRIAAISRLVPGAGQFSNSLYANLDEFRALKESLKREGIFDETWETLVIPRRGASSTLPYRP